MMKNEPAETRNLPRARWLWGRYAVVFLMLVGAAMMGCQIDNTESVSESQQTTQSANAGADHSVEAADSESPVDASDSESAADDDAQTAPPQRGTSEVGMTGEGGGFLWKPISESDGRLVVLLPSVYNDLSINVMIVESGGRVIEQGRFAGIHNNNRRHYRFSRRGAEYGGDVFVVADLNTGETVNWYIPNGASRTEY